MGDFCWQKREGHNSFTRRRHPAQREKQLKDRMKMEGDLEREACPLRARRAGPKEALANHVSDGRDSGTL